MRSLGALACLSVFAALLFLSLSEPKGYVFDEVYYIPAARSLIAQADNTNSEHPPLAKWLMGASAWICTEKLHLMDEATSARLVSALFGLWLLWGVRRFLLTLNFTATEATAAMLLTASNCLWFVQSKIATLDVSSLALSVWGLCEVQGSEAPVPSRQRSLLGWTLLGLAFACKWAAAPYIFLALLLFARRRLRLSFQWPGLGAAAAAYGLSFLPLTWLERNPLPSLAHLLDYHRSMLASFEQIANSSHSYVSHWWQWPTLLRPIWYKWDDVGGGLVSGIWAGGNPLLTWTALPILLFLCGRLAVDSRKIFSVETQQADAAATELALLHWVPLLFWALAPRGLQMYYYYFPSSIWVGAAVVWALGRLADQRRARALLFTYVVACACMFWYFLPILDARPIAPDRAQARMWLRSWI